MTPDMGIEEEYPQYTTFDQHTSQYPSQQFDFNTPPQPTYFNQTGSTTNFQNFQAAPTRRDFNPPRHSFDSAAGTRLSYGGNSIGQDVEDPGFIQGPSTMAQDVPNRRGRCRGNRGHYQLVTRLHDPFGNLNVDRTMVHVARNKIFICIVNVFFNVFNYNVFVSLMYFEMSLI